MPFLVKQVIFAFRACQKSLHTLNLRAKNRHLIIYPPPQLLGQHPHVFCVNIWTILAKNGLSYAISSEASVFSPGKLLSYHNRYNPNDQMKMLYTH